MLTLGESDSQRIKSMRFYPTVLRSGGCVVGRLVYSPFVSWTMVINPPWACWSNYAAMRYGIVSFSSQWLALLGGKHIDESYIGGFTNPEWSDHGRKKLGHRCIKNWLTHSVIAHRLTHEAGWSIIWVVNSHDIPTATTWESQWYPIVIFPLHTLCPHLPKY